MNVRKFTAPHIKDALAEVRRALGEDAVILRTRKLRKGGMLSFLHRELVEVTAATPDHKPAAPPPTADRSGEVRRRIDSQASALSIRSLEEDLRELKGTLRELSEQVRLERMPSLPERLAERYKDMIVSGLNESLAGELTQTLNLRFKGEDLESAELVDRELTQALASAIKTRRITPTEDGQAKVIALIGPTGVGKTTTMAKLVTSYRFWGKQDTALVSADTYRVAALEQLRTFASIAGLPMETVYQPSAMQNVLSRHRSRDAIFIDTAGRSQADTAKLDELGEFLAAAQPDEVLLCLAVSVRLEDQLDIIERYRKFNPTGIIFTKLDESRGPGMVVNVVSKTDLPVCCFTCGQGVPEDILNADAQRLATLILNPERLSELQSTQFAIWKNAGRPVSEAAVG